MKTKTLITVCLLAATTLQAQTFEWAKSSGGSSVDMGQSIIVDDFGNVYTTGRFAGTVDFDPGAGTFNLTSAGGLDVFIQKLDASGNFVWAKRFGGSSSDIGYSIKLDASGNVYTSGSFEGTVDFDPGPGTANLTSAGQSDVFVQKLDASGNFVWAKRFGGSSTDIGYSIILDASGNVYTTGRFGATVDFDPGVGTANLTSAGGIDVFIQKLDASGNFVWAKRFGGSLNDVGQSISMDASGNVYTTGSFQGTADFDPGVGTANLTSAGQNDAFVQKLDASGNFVWAKRFGGIFLISDQVLSITADASGNVYTTGFFTGTIDFDPGAGTANYTAMSGSFDVFVQKLDASGNFVWAQSFGGPSNDFGNSITLDTSGNVYITGQFGGTVDFDPGAGIGNLTSAGGEDVFIQKLDASGNFVWAKSFGGSIDDAGSCVTLDASGNVYATGYFQGTVDFDSGEGPLYLTSLGGRDVFVLKMSQCTPNSGIDIFTACESYTWIDGNSYTASNNTATYTLTNAAGCDSIVTLNLTIDTPVTADVLSDLTTCDSYELPSLTTGNYFTETNGGGTQLNAGDLVNATQTVYVYAENGTCSDETSFVITIDELVSVDEISDLSSCDFYELPALITGNYFTETNGGGTQLSAGDLLNTTQTVFVYAENGTCSDETSFVITIDELVSADEISDLAACDSYELPALTTGNYFTETNGGGTQLSAGDLVEATQTLYVYAENGTCSDETSFTVTINENPDNGISQNGLTLSADATGANYVWVDCNNAFAPIAGETAQTFTATENGSYAVQVSANGCEVVSECEEITTVAVDEMTATNLMVYPNPSEGVFTVKGVNVNTVYVIIDVKGRRLSEGVFTTHESVLDLSENDRGIYFLQCGNSILKLIKN